MVFSAVEGASASVEKVGVAQQWYDELDNCAFVPNQSQLLPQKKTSQPNVETSMAKKLTLIVSSIQAREQASMQVIVSAPLYLRLRKDCKDDPSEKAAQIANILMPATEAACEKRERFIGLFLNLDRDLGEVVFMKPLNVKIKFNTPNHLKAENSRDIILTE